MVCMALLFKMVFFTGRAGLSSFYEGSCRRLRTYGFLIEFSALVRYRVSKGFWASRFLGRGFGV